MIAGVSGFEWDSGNSNKCLTHGGTRGALDEKTASRLKSDKQAEDFVTTADLTEYDLSALRPVRFEFQPKDERVNMRLPRPLLDAVKITAEKAGTPYQRFIRQALEAAVQATKPR